MANTIVNRGVMHIRASAPCRMLLMTLTVALLFLGLVLMGHPLALVLLRIITLARWG